MKKVFYLGIAILLIASAIFIYGRYQRRLLREGLDKIEKVKVVYYGTSYHLGGGSANILYAEKDLIFEL